MLFWADLAAEFKGRARASPISGVLNNPQSLNSIVASAIAGLDEVLEREKPEVVISQGDTSTAVAAAIAAFNRGIPVVHLEAGLRTGNLRSPFPEEGNRRLIGQVASLHLAPTEQARENLLRESIAAEDILVIGNTVIDALFEATAWDTAFTDPRLREVDRESGRVVLVTTHRRENLANMSGIGRAMRALAKRYPDATFVLPAHLNPQVRRALLPEIEGLHNVVITDPLPYDEFTKLMARADVVLTDSGGVQEEAPALGKPVLVMREDTERPEAVAAGTVRLIGTEERRIVQETSILP